MSFSTSLSGLNAASADLDVTSNNIANVATTGFKGSRAEFSDVFASLPLGSTSNAIGSGVKLASVTQQFSQGNLDFTENTLDMSISGEGFFVLKPNQTSSDLLYTRAGAFQVDQNGLVVNNSNEILQVFPVDPITGQVTTTSLSGTIPLQVPSSITTAQATTTVNLNINLPAGINPAISVASIDAEFTAAAGGTVSPNPANYNNSTSATVFDSQGSPHILTMYFVMTDDIENQWEMRATMDGIPMENGGANSFGPGLLDFDGAGALDLAGSTDGGNITLDQFPNGGAASLPNGANLLTVSVDFRQNGNTITQESQGGFTVQNLDQDGFSTGRLSGVEISEVGLVRASFTNGQTSALGKVAFARFSNPQGLRQTGNTNWVESVESGTSIPGEAGTGNFGLVQSGSLETANVDLTAELVNLITAQRNFQANSKAIETANTITQTIINIS